MASTTLTIEKASSWRMFDRISGKYDLLNRLLSFGLDIRWRRKLVDFLPSIPKPALLDLATGTADVIIGLVKAKGAVQKAVGIDLAEKMLEIGRKKIKRAQLANIITLQKGDAQKIPFSDRSFDCVTMAFGIRNVPDTTKVMKEMFRVLKKDGRALILEFSLPANPVIRFFHLSYLRYIVPLLGGIISGNLSAYRYLNQTIENFPYGDAFCRLLNSQGFVNVTATPLLWGTATIYKGEVAP